MTTETACFSILQSETTFFYSNNTHQVLDIIIISEQQQEQDILCRKQMPYSSCCYNTISMPGENGFDCVNRDHTSDVVITS